MHTSHTIVASVMSETWEVASGSELISPFQPSTITLPIPISIENSTYTLTVRGFSPSKSLLFQHIVPLQFTPYFLSVTVQTSRPIYRSGQEVKFRIVILQTDLLPYHDDLDVFVLDPDGIIMRRWISIFTNNGVSSLSFTLPNLAKDGTWKIRTSIQDQLDEHMFQVQTYFTPLFEVFVELPKYTSDTETSVSATVYAMFATQKYVRGKGVLVWSTRKYDATRNNWNTYNGTSTQEYKEILRIEKFITESKNTFTLVFSELPEPVTPGLEVRLDVTVTELLSGETMCGYSTSRVAHSQVHVEFLSRRPLYYHEGKPLQGHMSVSYVGGQSLSPDILVDSQLKINLLLDGVTQDKQSILVKREHVYGENEDFMEQLKDNARWELFVEKGLVFYDFSLPASHPHSISVQATFTLLPSSEPVTVERPVFQYSSRRDSNQGRTQRENQRSFKKDITTKGGSIGDLNQGRKRREEFVNETRNGSIVVWTNPGEDIQVEDYVVFHVKTENVPDGFTSLVLSKNIVLRSEYHPPSPSPLISSISVPVSSDMSPLFTYVVYAVTRGGQLISDSVTVPVVGFNRYEQTMTLNLGKDYRGLRVEGIASGDEGAFIGFHAMRSNSYLMQAGNEMTLNRVMRSYEVLDTNSRFIQRLEKSFRDEAVASELLYLPTQNQARDDVATFDLLNLGVLTSAIWNKDLQCNNEEYCATQSCYKREKQCDGMLDCTDGTDEAECDKVQADPMDDYFYSVMRSSRNFFTFDAEEGDWGWREIKKNDHEGIEFEPLWSPSTGADWYFTAFSVSKTLGFSVLGTPEIFSSRRPVMAQLTGVSSCKRGEQVSLRVSVHNMLQEEMLVEVVLRGSKEYKFVHVEENGIVSSYGARLSAGDHQILVYLDPEGQERVDIPVAPVIEQGHVKVIIEVITQAGHVTLQHDLEVLGEGVTVNRHTSVFLDLKSRALVLRYLDIPVEETPLVPYQVWRRYVYGSPRASIMLSSDLIGPIPEEPAPMSSLLNRHSKSTDEVLFEFGTNIWTLHYLRLTNQLSAERKKSVLHFCNTLYAEIMRRYDHAQGGFKYWDHPNSESSVWLTAWVLRLFKQASYPDWEYLFYVDSQLYGQAVKWMLTFQTSSGAFVENGEHQGHAFDSKAQDPTPLTCHVLITLSELYSLISEEHGGDTRSLLASSNARSVLYLERNLYTTGSLYSQVLATYALFLYNSYEKSFAYARLMERQRLNNEGLIYFAESAVPSNPNKFENQRPFTQPRLYHANDSSAVESTAWALLVVLMREGVSDTSEKMVQWLTTMRMHQRAFVSTFDSMVALQALTEYAFRARLLTLTNIRVTLETPSNGDERHHLHLTNTSLNQPEIYHISKVWGHVNIIARGQGHALAGLDVSYGVDSEHLKDRGSDEVFQLTVTEFYSPRRNKSAITMQSCFRYMKQFSPVSGAAVLELDLPTGYHLLESQAMDVVKSRAHPTLRDVHTVPGKTIWYFQYISSEWSCFNHTVRRWYPVANLTLVRQALLYESTAREHFVQVLVNSTSLYLLNICEVCGSYQCPYCPYFNAAISILDQTSHVVILAICCMLISYYGCCLS
uniref:Complement C3 n=2 Tax=Cacopsylla melanoneura TaxID=428564 RepID=A0A8D8ZM66_9HEMI